MSKLQLSQTALYEILIEEIEILKKASKEFTKVYSQIDEHLQRLETLQNKYPHSAPRLYIHQAEVHVEQP